MLLSTTLPGHSQFDYSEITSPGDAVSELSYHTDMQGNYFKVFFLTLMLMKSLKKLVLCRKGALSASVGAETRGLTFLLANPIVKNLI